MTVTGDYNSSVAIEQSKNNEQSTDSKRKSVDVKKPLPFKEES